MPAWRRCRARVLGPPVRPSSAVARTARRANACHGVAAIGKSPAELEGDPDVAVAQTAVEVVQQMERNAREREHQAALAAQEAKQSAIEHQNPGQSRRSEAEQPDVKWRHQDEYAGQADEARTDSLIQLQVQVVRDAPAGEDQASPGKGATRDIRSDD